MASWHVPTFVKFSNGQTDGEQLKKTCMIYDIWLTIIRLWINFAWKSQKEFSLKAAFNEEMQNSEVSFLTKKRGSPPTPFFMEGIFDNPTKTKKNT